MSSTYSHLFNLPLPERLQLVADLWDSIAATPEQVPLPEWQIEELERRKAEYLRNPSLASSWEEVKPRIRAPQG
jgi:putative addiction module component (TIGR02574 family)